jgi:transcriptional regulator with XRE-family HTH domain
MVMTVQKLRPDMDIGHKISALRQGVKLTQDQTVAKMQLMGLKISKSSYAKIETNRLNIKVSELVALKQIFNVSFDAFFDGLA